MRKYQRTRPLSWTFRPQPATRVSPDYAEWRTEPLWSHMSIGHLHVPTYKFAKRADILLSTAGPKLKCHRGFEGSGRLRVGDTFHGLLSASERQSLFSPEAQHTLLAITHIYISFRIIFYGLTISGRSPNTY